MSIKLIAIDIDGTLVDKEFKITPEVKAAITEAREQGVKIVLCTGRPFPGVKRYIKELDLDQDEDYVITYNGSLVLSTATNEVLVSHTLDYSDFVRINELADKFNVHTHGIDSEAIYTANKDISAYARDRQRSHLYRKQRHQHLHDTRIFHHDDADPLSLVG